MNDPEELEPNQEFESIIRSAFLIQDPDPLFIDRLQKRLMDRFKDVYRSRGGNKGVSRHLDWRGKSKNLFTSLAWGAIGVILLFFMIWGIRTLLPGVKPGVSTQPTPLPSMVPTVAATPAEALESVTSLPVPAGVPVPWPEVAITADNAAQITQLARWGKEIIYAAAWAPDGNSFAVASSNKIIFYDPLNLNVIDTIYNGSMVYHIAYSPDSTKLASDFNGTSVKIWDIADGSELHTLTGFENFVTYLAFSPDGESLAVAVYQNAMKLWDVNSGQELRTFDITSAYIRFFVFSPDWTLLASTGEDERISLWDVASGEMLRNFSNHKDYITALAFSPDGRQLASASNDLTIKIWEVSTGNEIKTIASPAVSYGGLAFLPDGDTLMSLAEGGPITLWDIASGQAIRIIGDAIYGDVSVGQGNFTLSPDGKMVLDYSGWQGDAIRLFDVASGEELRRLDWQSIGTVYSIAFSPNGRLVAVGFETGGINLLDASTGLLVRSLSGHTKEVGPYVKAVLGLAFSPDGALLASGAMDNTVRLWDVASGEELLTQDGVREWGWTSGVPAADFSPDGKLLAFAGPSGQVKVWDVTQNVELRTLGGGADENSVDPVAGVAFSPDGKLLVSGYASGLVTVWDALSGQQLHTLRVSESRYAGVFSLEISPDGKILAVATYEAEVSFWDTTTWENIRTLSLPGDGVIFGSKMVFSPAGDVLVIGSDGSTTESTLLLDAASGKELIALPIVSSGLAFSPDGKILISGGFDGAIRVWGLAPSGTTQEEPTTVVPSGGITIIQEPTLAATPEELYLEKVPIPLLLSAEGIQTGEWSADAKYFYYSQQGPVGEPGRDMAEVTISFLDAHSGETCEGIREMVKMVTADGSTYPDGAGLNERARWLSGSRFIYLSPSGELSVITPCSKSVDNLSASLPDKIISLEYGMNADRSKIILKGESAYWLYTPATLQSVKLDIPLPAEGVLTQIRWIPGDENLYSSRIEDREGVLWIVLERINAGTGSASLILEIPASPEIRNSYPMWASVDWLSKDQVIVENTIDGMTMYDLGSQPLQPVNVFSDLFGIKYPGMDQLSAADLMCRTGETDKYLVLGTGFVADGQYYIYHFNTGAVDQYPLDTPLFVVFPCGESMVAQSFVGNMESYNTLKVILVDSGVEPYDLVAQGHAIGEISWSFATILPGGQTVMFSSVQGISLVDLVSGEMLNFWGLDNQVEYQSFYILLSPDGKTLVGFASQESNQPGKGSYLQDMYWLRLDS